MGNVVSSLLMYALQAAWYCQRLIDQDYRQNYGSRPKPIADADETDLDVFLSKCRSYYLSKGWREQEALVTCPASPKDSPKAKKGHRRSQSRSLAPVEAADYRLAGNDKDFRHGGADVRGVAGSDVVCGERVAALELDCGKSNAPWRRKRLDRLRYPAGRSLDGTYFPQDSYCTADGDFCAETNFDEYIVLERAPRSVPDSFSSTDHRDRLTATESMTNHDRSPSGCHRPSASLRRRICHGRSLDSPPWFPPGDLDDRPLP